MFLVLHLCLPVRVICSRADKLPVLGAIREYPQRDGNAKGSLPFSDAFPVMHRGRWGKKKPNRANFRFSPHRWMSLLPSRSAGERWARGVSAVEDLLNRFQEHTAVGSDSAGRKLLEQTSIPAIFSLAWTFSFQKLGGRIYCIDWHILWCIDISKWRE